MTGQTMSLSRVKGIAAGAARELYEHPANQLIATLEAKEHRRGAGPGRIGEGFKLVVAGRGERRALRAVMPNTLPAPGVDGTFLWAFMTIALEVGDLGRFASPGHVCQLLPDGGRAADEQ